MHLDFRATPLGANSYLVKVANFLLRRTEIELNEYNNLITNVLIQP